MVFIRIGTLFISSIYTVILVYIEFSWVSFTMHNARSSFVTVYGFPTPVLEKINIIVVPGNLGLYRYDVKQD